MVGIDVLSVHIGKVLQRRGVVTTMVMGCKCLGYSWFSKAYPFPSGEHDILCATYRRMWCGFQF
jgi:hypothetical protein